MGSAVKWTLELLWNNWCVPDIFLLCACTTLCVCTCRNLPIKIYWTFNASCPISGITLLLPPSVNLYTMPEWHQHKEEKHKLLEGTVVQMWAMDITPRIGLQGEWVYVLCTENPPTRHSAHGRFVEKKSTWQWALIWSKSLASYAANDDGQPG